MAVTEPSSSGSTRLVDAATPAVGKSMPPSDKSVKDLTVELKDLVLAYAKQETFDPLKALGRFLAFGVAGAVLLAVGTVLGSLAILRALQSETAPHLTGHWSWMPYLGGIAFALLVAGAAVSRIGKTK